MASDPIDHWQPERQRRAIPQPGPTGRVNLRNAMRPNGERYFGHGHVRDRLNDPHEFGFGAGLRGMEIRTMAQRD